MDTLTRNFHCPQTDTLCANKRCTIRHCIKDITRYTLTQRRRSKSLPVLPQRITEQVGENMLLNVDQLKIDHTYQRPADPYHIEAIANQFDLKKLFRIAVNKRTNGSYWILDGQQRVSAIKLLGGNYMIDCVVYHLATIEEEAALYYHLNWDRKNPNSYDRWKARLAQKNPDVMRIQRELDTADLKLAKSGNALRTIRAVGTLNVWVDLDVEVLSVVIMILGKFTYLEPIGAEIFSGLCATEHHLRQHSNSLTRARSAKETWYQFLLGRGYTTLREACMRYQSERTGLGGGGTSTAKKAAKGIIQLLNYNLKGRQLPQIED